MNNNIFPFLIIIPNYVYTFMVVPTSSLNYPIHILLLVFKKEEDMPWQ